MRQIQSLPHAFGHAEIHERHAAVAAEHDIGRFQIPVNDTGLVYGLKRMGNVAQILQRFVGCDAFCDTLLEIASLEILHHDEAEPVRQSLLEDIDHVRAVNPGYELAFTREPLHVLGGMRDAPVEYLDGDQLAVGHPLGLVDGRVTPAADDFAEAIVDDSGASLGGPFQREILSGDVLFRHIGQYRDAASAAGGVGQHLVDHLGEALRREIAFVEVAGDAHFDGFRHHVGISDAGDEDGRREARPIGEFLQPIQPRLPGSEVEVQQENIVGCPVEIRPRLAKTHARIIGEIHTGDFRFEKHAQGFERNFAVVDGKDFHGSDGLGASTFEDYRP